MNLVNLATGLKTILCNSLYIRQCQKIEPSKYTVYWDISKDIVFFCLIYSRPVVFASQGLTKRTKEEYRSDHLSSSQLQGRAGCQYVHRFDIGRILTHTQLH